MQSRGLDRLTAFAESYPELRDALAIELSPAREELLKRASVAPSFDEQIYSELCVGLDAPLSFANFTALSEIERVPYSGGRYWVRDSARPEYLRKWSAEDTREWSRRLARFFSSPADELKLLELRILFDPQAALVQFQTLYKQADDRFDLARCYALLGALRSRESALDVELYKALGEYFTLYSARARFSEEYHQTVDYFQRKGASAAFRHVRRQIEGKWILNVHGGGGMGKTMLLRWLISHRLVRRKMRVPCVRLDLDAFSLATVTESPWLLALPIAEQLQDQVGASTFATIARDLASYRRLLLTGEVSMTTTASFALAASAGFVDYLPVLQDAFRHMPQSRPVVLFLDTIEEATLHRPEKVMEVIDFFAQLHESAPHLRLVIAGRYQLGAEHLPAFASKYGAFTHSLEVKRLEDADSRKFFVQQAPAASAEVVDAVVSRAEGNPFKIALLAELIRDDSEIDRDRLLSKEFEDVEIAYLIQRVVSRIPEQSQLPLRWVVRYGAIARRLTPEFIENVLLPPLQRALGGEAQAIGDDMVDDAISRKVWRTESNFKVDIATIWSQLSQYASGHGWISIDKNDPNVARFHPDVVLPMRRLLSRQKVYQRLHADAASYFREQGATTDALYHQLQLRPSAAASDWQAALDGAAARMHPSQWRALAESLLEKDFVEADASAKAVAHWHVSEAIAFDAGCGSYILASAEFDAVQAHLRAAQQIQGEQRLIPESVWTCLAAANKFRADHDGAHADILRELAKPQTPADRTRFLLNAGGMEAQIGAPGEQRLLEAYSLLPPIPSKQYVLHERTADLLASRGSWVLARNHCDNALAIAVELGFESSIRLLRRRMILLDIATGRIGEAFRALLEAEAITPGQEPQDPEWFDLHAEIALASLRPAAAIDFASSLLQTVQGPSAAQACLYRAKAYQRQWQLSRAISEYQRAAAGFNEAGDLAGIDDCVMGELMLHALYSGDTAEAERLLSRSVQNVSRRPFRQSRLESARAFVAARKGQTAAARSILMGAIDQARSPQETAILLFTGLSVKIWDDIGPSIRQLIDAVADIQPATARLSLLENLSISMAWGAIAQEDRARLDELFVYEPQDDVERAVHALLKADLLRVIGEFDRALRLLDQAIPSMGPRPVEGFHYFERLQVESRIRRDGRRVPANYNPGLLENFNREGLIAAIIRMNLAEGYLDGDQSTLAEEALKDVDSLLRAEPIESYQFGRYHELLRRLARQMHVMPLPPISESEIGFLPQQAAPPAPLAPPPIMSRPAEPEEDCNPENLKCTLFVIAAPPDANQFMTFEPPSFLKAVGLNQAPILPILYDAAKQRIPTRLYSALAGDWKGAAEQMSALFRTRERSAAEPVRLLLDTSGNLAGIPWEFLPIFRGPRPLFRAPIRSQVLTATGDVGSGLSSIWKTLTRGLRAIGGNRDLTSARDALRSVPRDSPPRVMIISPGREGRQSEAGFAYTKVPDIYAGSKIMLSGFDSEANADSIERRVSESQPEVIVIFSEMIDSPSIPEPMLATGRLLPRTLSHILGRIKRDTPGPAIVLDVPLPTAPEHAIQQLHARNRFASELQRAGNVTAVIATGLGADEDVLSVHSLLVSSMLESASLDETLDSIRERYKGSSELRDALPYLGCAVLSNHPYQLLVPRAKPGNA